MKITEVKVIPVSWTLEEPLCWGSFTITSRGAILVKVFTDEGIVGWGEAGFSVSFYPVVGPIIERILKPLVVGEDPFDVERIWQRMFNTTHIWGRRGMETYALSGVEIALWDIVGKACRKPIYKLLGGYRDKIQAYWAPSLKEPEVVAKECAQAIEGGFTAIKLRVGLGLKKDIEIVKVAREAVGDKVELMVDANMAYDYRTAVRMAEEFKKYNIYWLEEPILAHSLEQYIREYSLLSKEVDLPIAGGECLFTRYEFGELISKRAVDIVQPDCTGVGGIAECRKIATIASVWNIPCVPHVACSSLSAVGLAANLHVIGSISNSLFAEYDAYDSPIRREILVEPIRAKDGYLEIPQRPGLGIELNEKAVAKYSLV